MEEQEKSGESNQFSIINKILGEKKPVPHVTFPFMLGAMLLEKKAYQFGSPRF